MKRSQSFRKIDDDESEEEDIFMANILLSLSKK